MAVVGHGRLGAALARAVDAAPGLVAATGGFDADADAVLFAVPDDRIAAACGERAWRPGVLAVHHAGSRGLDVLAAAAAAGAGVACLHPLQTFPDRETGDLAGVACAVTADPATRPAATALAAALGMAPFGLDAAAKPLYHAAAVAASNDVAAVIHLARRLLAAAGVPDAPIGPLARAALEAALLRGPVATLTGPVVRGDVGTLAAHRDAIAAAAPELWEPYRALALLALDAAAQRTDADPARLASTAAALGAPAPDRRAAA